MSKKKQKTPDPAAQALAKKRWASKTTAQKQAEGKRLRKALDAPEHAGKRKARASAAAKARWAKWDALTDEQKEAITEERAQKRAAKKQAKTAEK